MPTKKYRKSGSATARHAAPTPRTRYAENHPTLDAEREMTELPAQRLGVILASNLCDAARKGRLHAGDFHGAIVAVNEAGPACLQAFCERMESFLRVLK